MLHLCSLMVVQIEMGKPIDRQHQNYVCYRLPKPQDNFVSLTSMFAVSTGSIGVDLQDIPNDPIRFIVTRSR